MINNAKQIILACAPYASEHGGRFPDGNYDPELGVIWDGSPAESAEGCFTDLIETETLSVEKVFWIPQNSIQCSPSRPDETGILEADENCWDYITGLTNTSNGNLPLIFEASDAGTATTWSAEGSHPWKNRVIIGYVDGSVEKLRLTAEREAIIDRDGVKIHLCAPTPGKNN